ncbi:hypothetical protein TNCV_1669081 [Trichonephila clavipes]|nr:hypothetical protein TNCV_1669081 [Trichonephila clavipes]
MRSGLTPVAKARRQWNTHHEETGSELSLQKPISSRTAPSPLSHCGTNNSFNFCRRRSTMRHSRKPNSVIFLLSSNTHLLEPGLLEAVPSLVHCSRQPCTFDTF